MAGKVIFDPATKQFKVADPSNIEHGNLGQNYVGPTGTQNIPNVTTQRSLKDIEKRNSEGIKQTGEPAWAQNMRQQYAGVPGATDVSRKALEAQGKEHNLSKAQQNKVANQNQADADQAARQNQGAATTPVQPGSQANPLPNSLKAQASAKPGDWIQTSRGLVQLGEADIKYAQNKLNPAPKAQAPQDTKKPDAYINTKSQGTLTGQAAIDYANNKMAQQQQQNVSPEAAAYRTAVEKYNYMYSRPEWFDKSDLQKQYRIVKKAFAAWQKNNMRNR